MHHLNSGGSLRLTPIRVHVVFLKFIEVFVEQSPTVLTIQSTHNPIRSVWLGNPILAAALYIVICQ